MGKRPKRKPSTLPPPPPRRVTRRCGRLERGDILCECPGDAGVLLWRAARALQLWGDTPPARRGAVFAKGAADRFAADLAMARIEEPLRIRLLVLADVFRGAADEDRLVHVTRAVAEWAEQQGYVAAGVELAQAAAYALPRSALLAVTVGRLARRLAEYGLAESWFERAFLVARRTGDWPAYALALSGMGNLCYQRGNLHRAGFFHRRALRMAKRHSLHQQQAEALHDLFYLASEAGQIEEAEQYAERAFTLYGAKNEKLPRLAYDVVYFWLLNGRFEDALLVAAALPPHFPEPAERILVAGAMARAAGGAERREAFHQAHALIRQQSDNEAAAERVGPAWLGLAYGATSLGEWELATEAAQLALDAARARGQCKVVMEAEAVLDLAVSRRPAHPASASKPEHDRATLPVSLVQALAAR